MRATCKGIGLNGRGTQPIYGWVALCFVAVCTAAPCALAQGDENFPTIRVETRDVLIPTLVSAWVPARSYCPWVPDSTDCGFHQLAGFDPVLRLGASDFHLFEDDKEQKIDSATLMRSFSEGPHLDNLGHQLGTAITPRGEWKTLYPWPVYYIGAGPGTPLYAISYKPPLSPDGSCHSIRITVDPKDASGHKQTTAESETGVISTKESAPGVAGAITFPSVEMKVKRDKLLLQYRTQFCTVALASSDPLYGTPVSKKLENLAAEDKAEQRGLNLSAFELFDESGKPHLRVALDFPEVSSHAELPNQTDPPDRADLSEHEHKTDGLRIPIELIGLFNGKDGDLAARFSDHTSMSFPCHFYSIRTEPGDKKEPRPQPPPDPQSPCIRIDFYNHYETEADLAPGDYDLRVGLDFGGVLRRAEIPVTVRTQASQLAVGGIALCRRYFRHEQIASELQLSFDGIPTIPFELKPLVSRGFEFTPTGDTHFKATEFMAVYFEVFEPLLEGEPLSAEDEKVRVQFDVRVVAAKTGEVKSDTGFRPADGFVNVDRAVIPISAQVAIGKLGPGDYRLQVRVRDSAGSATDWRSTLFTRE